MAGGWSWRETALICHATLRLLIPRDPPLHHGKSSPTPSPTPTPSASSFSLSLSLALALALAHTLALALALALAHHTCDPKLSERESGLSPQPAPKRADRRQPLQVESQRGGRFRSRTGSGSGFTPGLGRWIHRSMEAGRWRAGGSRMEGSRANCIMCNLRCTHSRVWPASLQTRRRRAAVVAGPAAAPLAPMEH